MNKLTADKCRMAIESIKIRQASIREEIYLQALEIALPVLEQQENGDDGWVEWHGGECPAKGKLVDVKFRDGFIDRKQEAEGYRWVDKGMGYDIIAYRVIENEN